MAAFLTVLFDEQATLLEREIWLEPFAGGAGAGLALLDSQVICELWLIERNPALAALWRTIAGRGDALASRVEATRPTLSLWSESKAALSAAADGEAVDDLELGFAAFVVNRCSRSGIVSPTAGPLGGKNQSTHHIASRFPAVALADRIRRIGGLSGGLRVWEGDGIDRIAELDGSVGIEEEMMIFVDPPYFAAGNRLYAQGMGADDHRRLASALHRCGAPWLLTYDAHPAVLDLYSSLRVLQYQIPYTANRHRVESEYAVFADRVDVDPDVAPQVLPTGAARWLKSPDPDMLPIWA